MKMVMYLKQNSVMMIVIKKKEIVKKILKTVKDVDGDTIFMMLVRTRSTNVSSKNLQNVMMDSIHFQSLVKTNVIKKKNVNQK